MRECDARCCRLRREVHEELRAEAQGVCTVREQSGRRSLTPAEILQIKLKSDQNMYRRFWKDFERDSPIPPLPYHYQVQPPPPSTMDQFFGSHGFRRENQKIDGFRNENQK